MMTESKNISVGHIWALLQEVTDPEVPVLSVVDLGIVRSVNLSENGAEVVITPTYSGCPAIARIEWDIRIKLAENGFTNIKVTSQLSPAWTTAWMTESGKQQLKAYGIAPPNPIQSVCTTDLFVVEETIQCPRCNSYHTKLISQFGSTACKAFYQCLDCKEPFDYFKCH